MLRQHRHSPVFIGPPLFRLAAGLGMVAVMVLAAGCHSRQLIFTRAQVDGELQSRAGSTTAPCQRAGHVSLPPGVLIEDGITEDEAVALALWNNAAFQETLAELGVSGARLMDAGLLTDPELVVLFPVGPKQLEFTAYTAIDALWLRPIRLRAAELDLCRVGHQMVQGGLNAARDAQWAYADLLLAQQQAELAQEAFGLRSQIAELASRRLAAGDISQLEAQSADVQALQAEIEAKRAVAEVMVVQSRLAARLGLVQFSDDLYAVASPLPVLPARLPEDLVAEAMAMRPDLRGAEINLSAADKRADLAHWQFMRFDAGYDANAEGEDGYEAGPALRMTLPLFNGNRGQRAIAEAEQERAARQVVTLRDQIALDVKGSYAQASQAFDNLTITRDELLPELTRTVELAQRNYVGGGSDYFLVLQTTSQYLDARATELQLAANLRRAVAELERGVGHRIAPRTLSPASPRPLPAQPVEPAPELDGGRLGHAAAAAVIQAGYHPQADPRTPRVESRHSTLYDSIPELGQHSYAADPTRDAHRPGSVYLSDTTSPRVLPRQTGLIRKDQSGARRGSSR